MERAGPSFSGAEARSVVHDPENGVSEGVWVRDAIKRRHSHFEQQRSRPSSMGSGSESTIKARSQRASYQEPKTSSWDLSEFPAPPVPALRSHSHGEGSKNTKGRPPTNFSRHTSFNNRQNSGNSRGMATQNLTENEVPPPVPSNPQGMDLASAEEQNQQQQQSDLERDTMQSPDSGPPYAARRTEDYMQKSPLPGRPSDWLTTLYTISHLIFFSIIGTLARLGVQWFAFYPGTPIVTPVIWANVGGSFLMGFLSEDRQLFRDEWTTRERLHPEKMDGKGPGELSAAERTKIKKTVPLYVGLAVGFCGSFTSFSSFMRDVFLALSNSLPAPVNHPSTGSVTTSSEVSRNGGYSFLALLAIILATVALSLGALIVGAHTALALDSITPRIPSRFTRRLLDPLMVFLGFGCWLGALFLCIWPPDRFSATTETWRGTALFPILFAPTGCLLRFYASVKLNSLVPSFPLGTFAANMFGTAIEGMCYDIQHVGVGVNGSVGGGLVGCQVLQGVQDGFCGCLTTVSTWVGEINGLRRRSAYLYALASVVGGFCLMVVIMGSVKWTVGYSEPVCDTGYISKI
jgi:CrcB protein